MIGSILMSADDQLAPLCRVEILGPLRITSTGQTHTQFTTQKAAALVVWLAIHPGLQPRERVIDLLWPEMELSAGRNNLSTILVSLRRQFEPVGVPRGAVLQSTHTEVGLNPQAIRTDLAEFDTLLKQAAGTTDPAVRISRLQRAVDLYRGPLLPGSYQDWAVFESERVQARLQEALLLLASLQEKQGDLNGALATVQRALSFDPYSEELHCSLVRLYVHTGRSRNAREANQRFERLMQDEFGTTPSQETRRKVAEYLLQPPVNTQAPITEPVVPLSAHMPEAESFGPPRARQPATLPIPLSRFFGREQELTQLAHMILPFKIPANSPDLDSMPSRLVTLIGPGGIGKTRLAQEFARQAVSRFGSWCGFVSLADVADPDKIDTQIAVSLHINLASEISPLDQVCAMLEQQDMPGSPPLLILDNLEHLLAGAEEEGLGTDPVVELVLTLQKEVPGLVLICTSRRPLKVQGERLIPIHPLPLPPLIEEQQETPDLPELLAIPSVRLYVDRAQSVRPDFGLTPVNAPAIAALCRQLEGSPLALELAAAWVRVLPPRKMWERLTQGLDLPAGRYADLPPRHRSLTAALEWSFRLLTPTQQRFFSQLSVFRGGWTLESAEAVCTEPDALNLLSALTDASLVTLTEEGEQVRYEFLETVHTYSRQQCKLSGVCELLHRQHAEFFSSLAIEAEPNLRGTAQASWLARLEADHDNICAALDWYQSDARSQAEWHDGVMMLGSLYRFWMVRGHWRAGLSFSQKVLSHPEREVPPRLCARVLNGAGALSKLLGDRARARSLYEGALTILRSLGDRHACGDLLHNLGYLSLEEGDMQRAQSFYEESLAIAREENRVIHIADELHHLGMVAQESQDLAKAQTLYQESLVLRKPLGDSRGMGFTLQNLANILSDLGRYEESQQLQEENLAIRRELGDRLGIADALLNMARLAMCRNDLERVKPLFIEGMQIRQELGNLFGIHGSLELLATFALHLEKPEFAARLCGAAQALRSNLGINSSPNERAVLDSNRRSIQSHLDADAFATAWQAGNGLTWEEAVAEAFGWLRSL